MVNLYKLLNAQMFPVPNLINKKSHLVSNHPIIINAVLKLQPTQFYC